MCLLCYIGLFRDRCILKDANNHISCLSRASPLLKLKQCGLSCCPGDLIPFCTPLSSPGSRKGGKGDGLHNCSRFLALCLVMLETTSLRSCAVTFSGPLSASTSSSLSCYSFSISLSRTSATTGVSRSIGHVMRNLSLIFSAPGVEVTFSGLE